MVQHHPSKEMRMKARAKAIKNNSHSPRQSVLKKDAKVHNANNKSSPAAAHSAHRSKAASNSRAVLKPVKPFTSPQGRFSPAPKGSSDARSSEVVLRPVKPVRSSPRKSKRQLQKDAEEDVILLPAREDSEEEEAAGDDIFSDSTHSEFEYNRTSSSSKAADKHKVKDTVFTEQNPATPVCATLHEETFYVPSEMRELRN